jgi:hypothetical protein
MLHIEVRAERDYPDLQDEAEELFEIDEERFSLARMAKVLANRLMALHDQQEFVVTIEMGDQGASERSG